LKVGRVDAGVDDLAEELGAGLVVVGSRGYGALRRALMGSASLSLIYHAHRPVLVVRNREKSSQEGDESGDERHPGLSAGAILAAYDGSAESERAAVAAGELAGAFETELHLASVVDMSQVIPYAPAYARIGWEEEIEQAEEETYKRLEEVSDHIEAASGIQPILHVCNGQPSAEMVRLGDELGVGLTLVGSRGRGGIKRALMGSVSRSVALHAGGSVLVFRPVDAEATDGDR
jgi:nucleotide-binding universal stress UspA family protein